MTVRVYRSSDASAPALRGNTPGDLINLLDKCLVTGYGSKTAAGWTKPFTGTNVAVFRQGAGSSGCYLRVDDTSTSATNRGARVKGYEVMTDVNTGTPQPFPTEAQKPGGGFWWTKYSSSTAANPREWIVWADERLFYIYIDNYPEGTTQENNNGFYAFGDINAYKPGDATACIIMVDQSDAAPWTSQNNFTGATNMSSSGHNGLFMPRRFDQLGAPVQMGWHSDAAKQNGSSYAGSMSYPHGPDGALLMAPIWCHDPSNNPFNVRGVFPGIWAHCHPSTILNHLDTFDGQGDFAGRNFQYLRGGSSGCLIVDQSDNWR